MCSCFLQDCGTGKTLSFLTTTENDDDYAGEKEEVRSG
jgi:hypothetical protein